MGAGVNPLMVVASAASGGPVCGEGLSSAPRTPVVLRASDITSGAWVEFSLLRRVRICQRGCSAG